MMVEHRSQAAKKNLREGVRKMEEESMSPAARVRREFRLGRPPKKVEDVLPLHPVVVWNKAADALSDFRARMATAKLDPDHVEAAIVFIEMADQDAPKLLALEQETGEPSEKCRQATFKQLSRSDVIALGMIFRQFDKKRKSATVFPYQFMGLNDRGLAVMRRAATETHEKSARLTKVN